MATYSHQEIISVIEKEIEGYTYPEKPTLLYEPIDYILKLGGKRIRPSLTLMVHNLWSENIAEAINAALAVEVFHNFTLIHDDIMDKADKRRGKETVHVKWNENVGILSGDAMLILAYQLLQKSEGQHLLNLLPLFNKTAMGVCEGQQYDMDFETRNNVQVDEYIEMIRLKTSVLLAAAMQIGGITANASKEQQDILYKIGINLGLGFQLQDDYLDAFGDEKSFGKQTGGDIVQNKKTYLMLKSLEVSAGKPENTELVKWIESTDFNRDEKVGAVKGIYTALGVDKLSLNLANSYFDTAFTEFDKLDAPEDRKDKLKTLLESVVQRKK